MKSIALLGFVLAVSPTLAAAQSGPLPASAEAAATHPSFAAMEQMHAQLTQIHKDARLRILGALTPAHRTLLAGVVGQLATAPNPDPVAAAKSLDAALSPAEARSVVSYEAAAHTQSRALMEAFRAQFEASLTPQQRAEMQQRESARAAERSQMGARPTRVPDAGTTLLHLASGADDVHGGFGHGGPPPGN
jgi:Spy/CpxP family protein refolding chaperone